MWLADRQGPTGQKVGLSTASRSPSAATVRSTPFIGEASETCLRFGQGTADRTEVGHPIPGKAQFRLTLTAVFQPKCAPPMTLVFGPITITVSGDSFAAFSTTIDPEQRGA